MGIYEKTRIFAPGFKIIIKIMTIESIGTTAGVVWTALSTSGKMSVKELKKVTKIKTDKELYSALGWLAKEDKLIFKEKGEEMFIWLA